jgi:hypothetical protein
MLHTQPVFGDPTQLGASKVTVRFKEARFPTILHHAGEMAECQLILVDFNPRDSMYTLTYINAKAMILKRISYAREAVVEVTWDESVCHLAPPPKPPLSVVPSAS